MKTFPTLEVATCLTGIGLAATNYSRVQEIASALLGFPVWTHELAHRPTVERLRVRGKELFPNMPTPDDAEADWRAARAAAVSAYGETVDIPDFEGERAADPVETLREMKPDADIAVFDTTRKQA